MAGQRSEGKMGSPNRITRRVKIVLSDIESLEGSSCGASGTYL